MSEENESKRIMNIRIIAAAGMCLCATGLSILGAGVQLLLVGAMGFIQWLAFFKIAMGCASTLIGLFYTTYKGWTLVAAPAISVWQLLYFMGWFVYALLHGFFALITLMVLGLAFVSTILILISFRNAMRYHKENQEMFA